jgi:hypothetical protein
VGILDSIERVAPRLALYPVWARALFLTTFVAAVVSVFLYAVQYSGATREQEAARVSLAVTPSVLSREDAENANELAVLNEITAEDAFGAELTYAQRRRRDGVHFVPAQPYLDAVRSGGPVDARAALTPELWEAANRALVLDLKVTNNRADTLFLDSAILDVQSSAPDLAPVPVPTTLHDHARQLTVVNQGWGSAQGLVVRFNLGRGGAAPSIDPPYAHAARVGQLTEMARFDLDQAFAAEGADIAALRAMEAASDPTRSPEELLRTLRRAAAPFPISSPSEVSVPLAGELLYRHAGRDTGRRRLRFRAEVPVTVPLGLGAFEPPTARYRAVELAVRGRRYERRVSLAQSVKPGEVDRFELPLVVARSSRHRLRVRLAYGSGDQVAAGPFVLHIFVPRLR